MARGLLLLALLLSACVHSYPPTPLLAPFPSVPQDSFVYAKEAVQAQVVPLQEEKAFRVFRLTYASPLQTDPRNDTVEALLFLPRTVTRPPVVIFLPILHKGESLTDSFARYFAARGIAALSLRGKKNFLKGNQGLLFTKEVFRQMIVDIRRGMDWLEVQTEIDGKRIGICGLSLGAVESVIVAGVDNRVSCAAYLLGGGNIPKILMTSKEKDIVRFRRDTMAAEGLDAEGFYTKVLSGYQDIDPLTYAGRLPPQRVLMVNAYFDTVVRREYANALWERSGRPHRVLLPTGHFTAFLYLPYARWLTYRHFQRCLSAGGFP